MGTKRHNKIEQLEDEDELRQILERLDKLSKRPENPGLAYRNLETIHALVEALRKKILAPAETT